jgi:hypothetical protein
MNPSFFLISSYDPIPQHYLQGLCLQDEDIILGNEGYQKYVAARKRYVQPGLDGSYIIVRSSDEETIVGTDFSGYYKLFLYQCGERWALSNSLIELVRFAASKRLPVTIDESHLASFFIEGPFGDQLTSLRTSVKEIRLVSSSMEAVIAPTFFGTTVKLRPTAVLYEDPERLESYEEALRHCMKLWTGRMATLLQSDLYIRSDLTGGRDSRAVLSLMLAACRIIGEPFIRKVNITSDKDATDDFSIAHQIAERFHLRFMDKVGDPRRPVRLSVNGAYETWKSLCLGVYGPIYFPVTHPVPTATAMGGAGGEGHRRFYPNVAPETFINAQRKFIPSSAHFKRLKRDILDDLATLRRGPEASVDPMIVHYRHFRDRCHGGRAPQYGNLISPLSSKALRRASSLCAPTKIDRSQVLADILVNANRQLAAMAYDAPAKSFDARHFADLVDAEDAIRSARKDGQVFASEGASHELGGFTKKEAFRLLRDDFLDHYAQARGAGFFPKPYLEKAREAAENALLNGRFPHIRSSCAISHVILAGELARLSR